MDIMLIAMQCANILMNIGISKSVKKAYEAEVKKRLGQKYVTEQSILTIT